MLTDLPAETDPNHHNPPAPGTDAGRAVPILNPNFACAIQRVSFNLAPPSSAKVLLKFPDPEHRVAIIETSSSDVWPESAARSSDAQTGPDFDCICVDPSSAAPELLARLEKWIDPDGRNAANASARVRTDGGWVRVRSGRAVICAARTEWDGVLAALADFCFYECDLRKLEREIAADWDRAESDVPLANHVDAEDLTRLGDIGAMTRMVFMRRIRLAKLERPLAKCQAPLPESARKLAARLRAKFDCAHRAETLDGQIEVYEYIYEMASQRMGEYGNFRKEYLLEILIVVLLAGELIVGILEYLTHFIGSSAGQ